MSMLNVRKMIRQCLLIALLPMFAGCNDVQVEKGKLEPHTNFGSKVHTKLQESALTAHLYNSALTHQLRRILTVEYILYRNHQCRHIEEGHLFDLIAGTAKYHSMEKANQQRYALAKECFNKLRPLVLSAWEQGYLIALEDCIRGYTAFMVVGRKYDIRRYLPC